eukprot:scpid68130/ scgid26327/ EGF-like module-containing mucin-like hormone receptor-like 1; Cell surface glycoprotein F4/80; EGF-like module receptor 1; EMR1 hormone receptor
MKMFTAKLHVQTAIYIGLILAILCMQHSSGNRCLPAGHTNFTTTSFDRRTKTSRYVFSSGTRQSSPRDVISANATGSSVDFDFPPGCLMTFDSISFTSNGSCFYQVLYSSVQSSGRSNSQNIPFSVNSDADPNGQKVLKFVAMSDVSGSTVTFSAMQRLHPGGVHSPCIILVNAAGQPYVSLSAEDWNECSDTYNPPCYHGYSTASGGSHTQHCKNMFGSYECTCKRGYTRDHGICQDEDECRHLPDVCNADGLSNGSVVCANADGSYRCLCAAGFEVNSRSCQDVDECSRGTHRCAPGGYCVNVPGLYGCNCLTGYTGIFCDSGTRRKFPSGMEKLNMGSLTTAAIENFPTSSTSPCSAVDPEEHPSVLGQAAIIGISASASAALVTSVVALLLWRCRLSTKRPGSIGDNKRQPSRHQAEGAVTCETVAGEALNQAGVRGHTRLEGSNVSPVPMYESVAYITAMETSCHLTKNDGYDMASRTLPGIVCQCESQYNR